MVIYYHKKKKHIVASFPECYDLHPSIAVSADGEDEGMFAKHILNPEESLAFEDPRNPLNIHDHKVVLDRKGKVTGLKKMPKRQTP